jgi:hypothetical protein
MIYTEAVLTTPSGSFGLASSPRLMVGPLFYTQQIGVRFLGGVPRFRQAAASGSPRSRRCGGRQSGHRNRGCRYAFCKVAS